MPLSWLKLDLAYSFCNLTMFEQDESEWPHLAVLPSYGRGRDAPGGRFSSLIFGTNLTDVVITGIDNSSFLVNIFKFG